LTAPRSFRNLPRVTFDELKSDWNALGADDPLWAVLSEPTRKGGRWEPDEFFATGVADVGLLRERAAQLGVALGGARALDFGCGVGRLTRALARRFDEAVGIDVSERMLEHARRLNADAPMQ